MIEVIEQTIDRPKLDHDLIVPITRYVRGLTGDVVLNYGTRVYILLRILFWLLYKYYCL